MREIVNGLPSFQFLENNRNNPMFVSFQEIAKICDGVCNHSRVLVMSPKVSATLGESPMH